MASSSSSSSPRLTVTEILRKLQSVGFCSEPDMDPSPDNISSIFNRIVSVFFAEIHPVGNGIRPTPAVLGDGRHVDLFRLYFAVRDRGGYRSVSARRAWASVAEASGSDPALGPVLKLVYLRYLEALDKWLETVLVENKESKEKEKQFLTPVARRVLEADGNGKANDHSKPKSATAGTGPLVACTNKRKREELVGMLNWVLRVARNPRDPSVGKLVSKGRDKDKAARAIREVYSRVLAARHAIFLKKIRQTDVGDSNSQKGQKIHPSIYADQVNASNTTPDKVRCSKIINSVSKPSHSSPEVSTVRNSDTVKDRTYAGTKADDDEQKLISSSYLSELMDDLLSKDRIRIPIGAFFQAKVPAWTGQASAATYNPDDLKWLGTPIWPPQNQERGPPFQQITIGKGRKDGCRCKCPGSVECVRFHVTEKRLGLKHELGPTFNAWEFDRMGEEVALRWTKDEVQNFKSIVRRSPSFVDTKLWDQLHSSFPSKGTRNLVNYYFNVFLLARRSYQNRLTPNNIDSDDEETEFGFLSNPFGLDVIKIRTPKPIFCAQNAQCVDVDE